MASSPHGAQTCFSLWPNLPQIGGEQRTGGTSGDWSQLPSLGRVLRGREQAWPGSLDPLWGRAGLGGGDDIRKRKFLFSLKENFPTIEDL